MIYLITYDLANKPKEKYKEIDDCFTKSGVPCIKAMDSVWLLAATKGTADDIYKAIGSHFTTEDKLIITTLNPSNRSGWLDQPVIDWINNHKDSR